MELWKHMPETRRTNMGFLSDNKAARERQRIQAMVRSVVETKQAEDTSEANNFIINPKFGVQIEVELLLQ
jgi:hypothetical protein